MPALSNIEASRRSKTYRLLGSFWNNVFQQKDKAKVLIDIDFRNQLLGGIHAAVNNAAGNSDLGRKLCYIDVPFDFRDVVETGMLVYNDTERTVYYGTSYNDASVVYDRFRIRYFALPFKNIIPSRIQAKDKVLVLGTDFFVQANQWLFFREDPRVLFPTGIVPIIEGSNVNYRSYMSFLTRMQLPGNDDLVVQWLRTLQTIHNFKLALAAVGRLGIIRKGGELQSISKTKDGSTIYVFENEAVRVDYEHEPLTLSQRYDPDTIIGNVIQVFQPQEQQIGWWRQVDWRGGLVLDPMVPNFHNLPLLDADTVAYTAGQDPGSFAGSRVHARLQLSNNFDSERAYWDYVQATETKLGIYFNRVIGCPEEIETGDPNASDTFAKMIANWEIEKTFNQRFGLLAEQPALRTLPSAKLVNALDSYFEAYFGRSAFVVTIDMSRLRFITDVLTFIRREAPAGAVMILFGYFSSIPTDQIDLSVDFNGKETVVIQGVAPEEVTETVYLESFITERVSLNPIFPA